MKAYTFNAKELASAAKWASEHVAEKHVDEDYYPRFALRNHGHCGIGILSVITCETCDAKRVENANNHDITDYDCW